MSPKSLILPLFMLIALSLTAQTPGGAGAQSNNGQNGQQTQESENECLRLLQRTSAPREHRTINQQGPTVLIGDEGTEMLIPANSFVHQDGSPVDGEVMVSFTEVANKPELIMSNLPTVSNGKMLVSGGVLYIEATANGQQLKLDKGKAIAVNFPTGHVEGMQLFKGQYDPEGSMNWEPMADGTERASEMAAAKQETEEGVMPLFLEYGKADPRTFTFADKSHTVHSYIMAMLETNYKCVGNDAVYIEIVADSEGKGAQVKTLTGKNACYRLAIEEVVQTIQWDVGDLSASRTFYFELKPNFMAKEAEGENLFASLAGNPDAFSDENLRKVMEAYVDQERAKNFAKNAFSVTSLGWINCDKFYDEGKRVDVFASIDVPEMAVNSKVFLVFSDINSVMEGAPTGTGEFRFANIPEGRKARVVAMAYQRGNGAYLSVQNVTTAKGNVGKLQMATVSEDELKKQLSRL